MEIIAFLIPAVLMLFMMGGMLLLVSRMYKRIPANRALVRTGIGGTQVSCGTGAIVVPTMHTYGLVSLEPVRVQIPGAVVEGNDAESDWQFTVAVGGTRDQIMAAATRLLDKESDEIAQLAREIITGELSGSRDESLLIGDSRDAMRKHLHDCLGSLGLELISWGPVEFGDSTIGRELN